MRARGQWVRLSVPDPQDTPPPLPVALLVLIVQLVRVTSPCRNSPPPKTAVFPEIVLLLMVIVPKEKTPPPCSLALFWRIVLASMRSVPLLWIPAAIWLFYHGAIGWAIFLMLWGLIVVSGVDNVIKPLIISRGSNLPFVLVFLGVLGGIVAFGFLGVFLGPTLLAVGYRLLLEWSEVEQPAHTDVEPKPVSDPR